VIRGLRGGGKSPFGPIPAELWVAREGRGIGAGRPQHVPGEAETAKLTTTRRGCR
jgi:hypothetical protein